MNVLLRKIRFKFLLFGVFFALLLVLSACEEPTESPSPFSCLQPPVKVAFPVNATADPDFDPTVVPIGVEWEPQLSANQSQTIYRAVPRAVRSIVATSSDTIWLIIEDRLMLFQPSTGELSDYVVQIQEGAAFVPIELFLADDGTLWSIGNVPAPSSSIDVYFSNIFRGFLSRYDESMDRFVPIIDRDAILIGVSPDAFAEDSRGNLWFILDHKTLIRFDPRSLQAEIVLEEKSGDVLYGLAVSSDDIVWLAVDLAEHPGRTNSIQRYDPQTGEIRDFGRPPGADGHPLFLAFDREGRLWANDFGWFEFTSTGEPVWWMVMRSPVFLNDRVGGESQYYWNLPRMVLQSSNGWHWFRAGTGLVKLDLATGEWCLVTTLSTPIAEDENHNLWIAGRNQIYKYQLEFGQ